MSQPVNLPPASSVPPTGTAPPKEYKPGALAGPAAVPGTEPSALFGATQVQFSNPPTNAEMLRAAEHMQRLLATQEPLSVGEAQKIVQDAKRVLESGKQLLLEKNADEKAQKLIVESRMAGNELANKPGTGAVQAIMSLADSQLIDKAQRKLYSARNLVMLLVRSSQFRNAALELMQLTSEALGWKASEKQGKAGGGGGQQKPAAAMPTTTVPVTVTTTTTSSTGAPPHTSSVTVPVALPALTDAQLKQLSGQDLKARKAQVRARIRTVLATLAEHEAFRRGVKNLLRAQQQIYDAVAQAGAAGSEVKQNVHVQNALFQAKMLLQAFCGNYSIEPFCSAAKGMCRMVRDDPALGEFLVELRAYLSEGMQHPQEVFGDDARLKRLLHRGRRLFRQQIYQQYITVLMAEAPRVLKAIADDATTKRFVNDVTQLGRDLFLNTEGKPSLKLETMVALKDVMINMLLQELRWVQVPRIEIVRGGTTYVIDNLTFNALSILPENIMLKTKQKTSIKPRNVSMTTGLPSTAAGPTHERTKGYVKIKIHDITAMFRAVQYQIRRGKFIDNGTADVQIGDKHGKRGMRISITLRTDIAADRDRYFAMEAVKVHTDKLKWSIHSQDHRIRMKLVKPFINLRRRIDVAVEQAIIRGTRTLELQLLHWSEFALLPGNLQMFAPLAGHHIHTGHGTLKEKDVSKIMNTPATMATTSTTTAVPPASGGGRGYTAAQ